MRTLGTLAITAALAAAAVTLHGQTTDPASVLTAARDALGGDAKLSAIKSFVATGRTRQVRGNNLVPIEFEISCELPDKFVRHDEMPAQDLDPTTIGFNGDTLIQDPAPGAGRGSAAAPGDGRGRGGPGGRGGPPDPAQRLANVKQDFARLMLGVFAASFPSYPVTFRYGGVAEAPEGQADVVDVAGAANFSARLVVQRSTHLPVMLMWRVPGQPSPVEHRLYYSDYRDAGGGIKWPFRLKRAIAGDTVEETTFDRVRVNVKIDPNKFEPRK